MGKLLEEDGFHEEFKLQGHDVTLSPWRKEQMVACAEA